MIWFGIGVVITVATYAFAVSRGGGTYLVSYGPMVVGVVSMVRGGIDIARERRARGPAVGGAAAGPGAGATGWGPAGQAGGPAFARAPGYESQSRAMPDAGMPGGMRPGAMSMAGAEPGGPAYGPWQGARNDPRQARPGHAPANVPPPNWYPDPRNPAILRWWDGQTWTDHTHPSN
jgi:Protein of unknown function (DUF2510)